MEKDINFSSFLRSKKFSDNQKTIFYLFVLTTSVLEIVFVFNQLFFHIVGTEMCKLPSTGKTWKWNIDILLTILFRSCYMCSASFALIAKYSSF